VGVESGQVVCTEGLIIMKYRFKVQERKITPISIGALLMGGGPWQEASCAAVLPMKGGDDSVCLWSSDL